MVQILIWLYAVRLCGFHHGVYNRTGLSSFERIKEQPVLTPYRKRANRIFGEIVRDRHFSVAQKCGKRLPLFPGIPDGFGEFASFFRLQQKYSSGTGAVMFWRYSFLCFSFISSQSFSIEKSLLQYRKPIAALPVFTVAPGGMASRYFRFMCAQQPQ